MSNGNTERTKNYACIIYPDSAPKNYIEILEMTHVPILISPIHDKDVQEDGTQKKPHYHILAMYDGQKTEKQAREIFDLVNGVGLEKVVSKKGYIRYLIHADSTTKAKYKMEDIVALSGASIELSEGIKDKYDIISELLDYAVKNGIIGYATLLLQIKNINKDWFVVACDHSYTISQFLKSYNWELRGR